MSQNYFDVIERELGARCRKGAHRRHRRRWLPTRGAGRVGTVLAYAVPVVVAAGIAALALALHHGSRPGAPSPSVNAQGAVSQLEPYSSAIRQLQRLAPAQRNEVIAFVRHLNRDALRSSPTCVSARAHHPAYLHGPAPAALTRMLAVLRRPAGPEDRPPQGDLQGLDQIYVDAVRLARVADGYRIYLIPAISSPGYTPACLHAERAAISGDARRLAPSLRGLATTLSGIFVGERQETQGVGVVAVAKHSGWGFGPVSAADLGAGRPVAPTDQVAGIVPDGVARVEVFYRWHGQVTGVNTLPSGNVFLVPRVRGAEPGFLWVTSYDARGRVMRTVAPLTGFGTSGGSWGWAEARSSASVVRSPAVRHSTNGHR